MTIGGRGGRWGSKLQKGSNGSMRKGGRRGVWYQVPCHLYYLALLFTMWYAPQASLQDVLHPSDANHNQQGGNFGGDHCVVPAFANAGHCLETKRQARGQLLDCLQPLGHPAGLR